MDNQENKEVEINLLDIVKKALSLWWIWVFTTIVGGVGGFFGRMYTTVKTYTASTMLYVNNSSSISSALKDITTLSISDISASQSAVDLYCIMIKTRTCLDKVNDRIVNREDYNVKYIYESFFTDANGDCHLEEQISSWHPGWKDSNTTEWSYGYNYVNAKVGVASVDETEVFTITVTSIYPLEAILLSNVVADVTKDHIAGIVNGTSVKIVDRAQVATQVSWGRSKYAVIGGAVGAIVGLGIVLLLYFLQDDINDQKWFTSVYPEFPILATIPDANEDSSRYGYYKKKRRYGYGYGYSKGYYGSTVKPKVASKPEANDSKEGK